MLEGHANLDKYRNLVLYILERANDVNLGKKKLFKLLYFIDFDFYERHDKSLTGETYIVQQYGPVPAKGEAILKRMQEEGWVEAVKARRFGYEQHRFIAQRKADSNVFSGDELQHIDATLGRFEHYDGAMIETAAKQDIPYRATKGASQKVINYELVAYRSPSSVVLDDEDDAALLKSKPLQAYLEKLLQHSS